MKYSVSLFIEKNSYYKFAFYKNSEYHRVKGPAVKFGNGDVQWLQNGRFHRLDGPAIKYYGSEVEVWFENGRRLTNHTRK